MTNAAMTTSDLIRQLQDTVWNSKHVSPGSLLRPSPWNTLSPRDGACICAWYWKPKSGAGTFKPIDDVKPGLLPPLRKFNANMKDPSAGVRPQAANLEWESRNQNPRRPFLVRPLAA